MESKKELEKRIMNSVNTELKRMKWEKENHNLSFEDEYDLWENFPEEKMYIIGLLEGIRYFDSGLAFEIESYIEEECSKLVENTLVQWLQG